MRFYVRYGGLARDSLEASDFITIQEAADRMGINQRRLRYILQQGKVDFGFAYTCDGDRHQYIIFRKDFDEFITRHKYDKQAGTV